jgi:hypothetical protein
MAAKSRSQYLHSVGIIEVNKWPLLQFKNMAGSFVPFSLTHPVHKAYVHMYAKPMRYYRFMIGPMLNPKISMPMDEPPPDRFEERTEV